MTCIVAVKEKDGSIVMGSDAAGSDSWSLIVLRDPKIYRVGSMLIGFTTSFRMGQLLGHSLSAPEHHSDVPVEKYIATTFMNAVRDCLKNGGWAERDKDQERGGNFLIAYKGRIFQAQPDYSVIENGRDYDACGSGYMLALGSLHSTAGMDDGRKRAELALQAAEDFCASVRGPMRFDKLEPTK